MTDVVLVKTQNGFEKDYGCLSHRMIWDRRGIYLGQWQTNCLALRDNEPDELFIRAQDEDKKLNLTTKKMIMAT